MKVTESKQNLLGGSGDNLASPSQSTVNFDDPAERPLGPIEKTFLLHAERGDCATVRRLIEEHGDNPSELDINCVDPLNRSALVAAIENENIELIKLLLDHNIKVKDGLLHAIKEEYVEAVETLLIWEEEHHKPGEPYSWEAVERGSATFTADITPLILAAHKNNYEIIKILLDRGATLPMPHDVKCGCDECVESSSADSLQHSQSRINAYRALSASSLIALSSRDPLLTAFELSWELRNLSKVETEFRSFYNEMRASVQNFATSLLDHARTSEELEIMLNYAPTTEDIWEPGERQTLERLKLAIKYKQKMFVAHPNVQQLLAAIWYEGLPGFRRKSLFGQLFQVGKLGASFPVYCTIYMFAPNSEMARFMKKPFVKFICHSSSYALFLMLLGAASQRVEVLAIEWFGTDWMQDIVKEWKRKERGAGPGLAECGCILYVISQIWGEIRSLWSDGLLEYIGDLWNIVDFITNMFYVIWLALRMSSWFIVWREERGGRDPYYPREQWDSFEPILLSEGAFAAGMIFSFLKLVHIFSVNPHLGPLQISLGRMIIDIVKFFFIYTLVLFAFGCGLNQLLWYYAELEKNKCYHLPSGLPDFDNNDKACTIWRRYANMFETSQSLFWASFGLVDLVSFELTGIKGFTRFWALLMFGSYSVINVIVLLNMLIAMMSNSYQIISERSDTEWKFARSRLWMSYFDDGDTLPPPFNIFPTLKHVSKFMGGNKNKRPTQSFKNKSRDKATSRHEIVMRLLIRRYVTAEQRKRDDFGITEDDVMEIRQDISTLRYELIDILRQNGMKTPQISSQDAQLSNKKGKVMERRLLKDFHIGIVEGIVSDVVSSTKEPKDVFSQIAKVIGRRSSNQSKKKDWNALVRQNTVVKDPIGSAQEAETARKNRQSLRKHILTNIQAPETIDPEKLLEYNPKLLEVPKTARLAYAKFMTKKIQQDFTSDDNVTVVDETTKKEPRSTKTSVTFRGATPEPKSDVQTGANAKTNINAENKNVSLKKDPKNIAADDSSGSNVAGVLKQSIKEKSGSIETDAKISTDSKIGGKDEDKTKAESDTKEEPKRAPPEIKPKLSTIKRKEAEQKREEAKSQPPEKEGENETKSASVKKTETKTDSVIKTETKSDSVKKIETKDNDKSQKETPATSSGSANLETKAIPTGRSKLSGNIRTGWI